MKCNIHSNSVACEELFHLLPQEDLVNKFQFATNMAIEFEKQQDGVKDVKVELSECNWIMVYGKYLQLFNFFYYGLPSYSDEKDTPYDNLRKWRAP